jgi:hypothetical protein
MCYVTRFKQQECKTCPAAVLQAYAMKAGPACSAIVKLLLNKGVKPGPGIESDLSTANVTPLHLLACWSPKQDPPLNDPESTAHSSSSSSRKRSSTVNKEAMKAAKFKNEFEQMQAVDLLLDAARRAAGNSGFDLVELLVNAPTVCNRETPLTFAAYTGAYLVAEALIEAGADVNKPRSKDAARPLDLAVDLAHGLLAILLLENGAEVGLLSLLECL